MNAGANRWLVVAIGAGLALGGCARKASSQTETPRTSTDVASVAPLTGEAIYQKYCAVCHMTDGSGVPNFQPPLRGSAIVAGDPARLEAVIRAGSAALQDRESNYSAVMPPFGTLTDAEVRAIVDYVRQRFGNAANPPPS
jgi:mono/diheme cytochrome c family protein